jgi:hypothetical protein
MSILERKDMADEFVDTAEVEDPACMSLENGDPHDVFRDYVLPRIEASPRDEASAEVLAAMRAGRSYPDAVLDAIEALPGSATRRIRAWVDEARGTHVYRYVRFHGDYVTYGLVLTAGGPEDKAIARERIGEHYLPDDFIRYWKSSDAIRDIANHYPKHAWLFEESPFVNIESKGDYDAAIFELNIEGGGWRKPGLYDFRDEPPSYHGTVDEYVRDAVRAEAEDVLSSMDEDDIKDVCGLLQDRR